MPKQPPSAFILFKDSDPGKQIWEKIKSMDAKDVHGDLEPGASDKEKLGKCWSECLHGVTQAMAEQFKTGTEQKNGMEDSEGGLGKRNGAMEKSAISSRIIFSSRILFSSAGRWHRWRCDGVGDLPKATRVRWISEGKRRRDEKAQRQREMGRDSTVRLRGRGHTLQVHVHF